MTWEIVAGIIALITVGIAVGKVISNNTAALTRLTCAVERLTENQKKQDERLVDIERRVREIEIGGK